MSSGSRRVPSARWRAAVVALAVAAPVAFLGCAGNGGAAARTPPIQVVTGLYPLAQAVQQIGGGGVSVTDVVPPGADPRSYRLTAAQIAEVNRAAVVIVAGAGFQPSLDAAASSGPHVLDLQKALATSDPFVWLDPQLMTRAVAAIASTLEATNQAAAGQYRNGARAFAALVTSTGIDYESTLSVCPRRTIVTADSAFAGMARRYGLADQIVGSASRPDAAAVTAAAAAARSAGITTVFSEPFVPDGSVTALAAAVHAKVRSLDPLTGPPPGGWPRQADYVRLMEANLGALNRALSCPGTSSGM